MKRLTAETLEVVGNLAEGAGLDIADVGHKISDLKEGSVSAKEKREEEKGKRKKEKGKRKRGKVWMERTYVVLAVGDLLIDVVVAEDLVDAPQHSRDVAVDVDDLAVLAWHVV